MRHFLACITLIALVTAACSSSDESADDTQSLRTDATAAAAAVTTWLDAMDAGAYDEAAAAVSSGSLAIIVGTENSLTGEQVLAMADQGVSGSLAASYWASFAEGFEATSGIALGDLTVGEADLFATDGREFGAVAVGTNGTATEILVVWDGETWLVDAVATFGLGLVRPLEFLITSQLSSADPAVRSLVDGEVKPALRAGLARMPGDVIGEEFRADAEALLRSLES